MKKNLKTFNLVSVVFSISFLLLLSSCENFLQGNSLKEALSEAIEYANQPELEILFSADQNTGTVYPAVKGTYKVSDTFDINFEVNPNYLFEKWTVIDYSTKNQITNVLQIENPLSVKTNVKVTGTAKNVQLYPKTKIRPAVTETRPLLSDEGVSKDSSILHYFFKKYKFSKRSCCN